MSLLGGRFRLEREIGAGGMARVFLGRDEVLERPVAVKVLCVGYEDADIAERFRREGRTAARLSHPNIVQVYDAGEGELDGREVSYIVMEYVPGGDLKRLLDERGTLSGSELSELAAEVCAGLAHAHGRGIVHRDIKPHNILLDERKKPKLTDFGIARALNETRATRTGLYLGTATYSSPEQLQGQPATPKSDVYSLGITLYQAAVGEPPFYGNPIEVASQHVGKSPVPPRQRGAAISPGLEALILDCLAKDPEARPTAEELEERFSELGATGATRAYVPSPSQAPTAAQRRPVDSGARRGRRRRRTALALLLAALLAMIGAIAAFALSGKGNNSNPGNPPANQARKSTPAAGGGQQTGQPVQQQSPQPAAPPQTTPQQPTTTQAPPQTTSQQGPTTSNSGLTSQAAAQTVERIYIDAAERNYGASYNLLSSGFKQSYAPSQAAWANQFKTLKSIRFVKGPTASVSGNTATVTGVTIARHEDHTERNTATWTLTEENGQWKLSGLNVHTERI